MGEMALSLLLFHRLGSRDKKAEGPWRGMGMMKGPSGEGLGGTRLRYGDVRRAPGAEAWHQAIGPTLERPPQPTGTAVMHALIPLFPHSSESSPVLPAWTPTGES